MDDTLFVRGLECLCDLARDWDRVLQGQRSTSDAGCQRLAVDQFEDQRSDAIDVFQSINGADVWMIEGCEHPRFVLEAGQSIGVARKRLCQNLDGDVSSKPGIARAVDLTHPARAEGRNDFVRTDTPPYQRFLLLVGKILSHNIHRRPGRMKDFFNPIPTVRLHPDVEFKW